MVKDAQAHTEEDKRRREEVEVRNNADSIAYQVERQINDLGDRVPVNEKARAEQLIAEIRRLVKSELIGCGATAPAHQRPAADCLCACRLPLTARRLRRVRKPADAGDAQSGGAEDVIDAEFKQTK